VDIEDFVPAREAGKMLNVNRARIGVLCREGRFKGAVKTALGWMIPREDILNFERLPPGLKPKTPTREDDKKLISKTLKTLKEGDFVD
jgi:hypothetical protein